MRLFRSFLTIQKATRSPCWPSFGTVRKKKPLGVSRGLPGFERVRATRVAEPVTAPRPPFLYTVIVSWTSWLPAGPVTARIFLFDANACATARASDVFGSCVSPRTSRIFFLCVRFQIFAANFAQRPCCWPIDAAGPVAGNATPIFRLLPHLTFAVAADFSDALVGPRL